jgi:hypothetical protein
MPLGEFGPDDELDVQSLEGSEDHLPGAVGAVRVGSTVRKIAGPWTSTIHELLTYLRGNGFSLAPEPLGIDDRGREILSWLDGEPANRPWPSILRSDDGVIALTRALRHFHDIVRGFDPGAGACWRAGSRPVGSGEIVCHGDFGPWNTLWRSSELVGVIDWDMAEPGPPLMDVAFLALHLVPLRSNELPSSTGFDAEPPRSRRLALLLESYGGVSRREVIEAVFEHHARDRERTITWGAEGREPWSTFLSEGDLDLIDADNAWLQQHEGELISE